MEKLMRIFDIMKDVGVSDEVETYEDRFRVGLPEGTILPSVHDINILLIDQDYDFQVIDVDSDGDQGLSVECEWVV